MAPAAPTFDRTAEKGLCVVIDLDTGAPDLGFGGAVHTHRLDQVIDRATERVEMPWTQPAWMTAVRPSRQSAEVRGT
jgi:hypothetical protein